MRDDVLMQLTDKLMTDANFREKLRSDLEPTLKANGFDLNFEELAAVREFHAQSANLTDAQLTAAMADPGQRRQFAS